VSIDINDIAIRLGERVVISSASEAKFISRSQSISFLLPKYFNILGLCESKIRVTSAAKVYSTPTYFSEINLVKNVEFTYADSDICSVNRNDRIYILFIFAILIIYLYT
jgi:hypothetical protein